MWQDLRTVILLYQYATFRRTGSRDNNNNNTIVMISVSQATQNTMDRERLYNLPSTHPSRERCSETRGKPTMTVVALIERMYYHMVNQRR